ncbi:hypothetical protein GGH92_004371 [Coemansia sp. RSA 2673]|nr:hypothetical protein GGH92_004371 [Coemansia sp. RSA 2673]
MPQPIHRRFTNRSDLIIENTRRVQHRPSNQNQAHRHNVQQVPSSLSTDPTQRQKHLCQCITAPHQQQDKRNNETRHLHQQASTFVRHSFPHTNQ